MANTENDSNGCNLRRWIFCSTAYFLLCFEDLLICRSLLQNLSKHAVIYVDGHAGPSSFLERLTEGLDCVQIARHSCTRLMSSRLSGRRIALVTILGHFFGRGISKAVTAVCVGVAFANLRDPVF